MRSRHGRDDGTRNGTAEPAIVAGGACQGLRNPQDTPVKFFFTSPGAKVHVIVDLVRIDIDQGQAPAVVPANRRWRPDPTVPNRVPAFEASPDGVPGERVGVRDPGCLRMFAAGESFFFDGELNLTIANQGRGAFVIGTIDSQNQVPSTARHATISATAGIRGNESHSRAGGGDAAVLESTSAGPATSRDRIGAPSDRTTRRPLRTPDR